MAAPTSSPQGCPEPTPRKTGGRLWLWVSLAGIALVAGLLSANLAFTRPPVVPSAPPAASGPSVSAPAPHHVTVYGEVRHQGRFEPVAGEKVGNLVLRAGGLSPKAKDRAVKVIRRVPGKGNMTLVVNLRDVLTKGQPEKDIPVLPGDTVIVEEKLIDF